MVQCLRLCDSTAGGTGSIPGWGTSMPRGVATKKKKKGIKKEGNPAIFETWMTLEDIMLREISQSQKDKYRTTPLV